MDAADGKSDGEAAECKSVDCYCGGSHVEGAALTCNACGRLVHLDCLKSGRPSPIAGDIFFSLVCAGCSGDGHEVIARSKLAWQTVVHLALYNLQLQGGSKCGYFKWKESVCTYIDKYWHHFFGYDKKKGGNWYGTVAGTLSIGSPHLFQSGAAELQESGWWKLATNKPPAAAKAEVRRENRGRQQYREPEVALLQEGSRQRRAGGRSLMAAIELKARRDTITQGKKRKLESPSTESSRETSPASDWSCRQSSQPSPLTPSSISANQASDIQKGSGTVDSLELYNREVNQIDGVGVGDAHEKHSASENKGKPVVFSESVSALLGDTSDDDIDIDPCDLSPQSVPNDVWTPSEDTFELPAIVAGSQNLQIVPPECGNCSVAETMACSHAGELRCDTVVKQEPIADDHLEVDHVATRASRVWEVSDNVMVSSGPSADLDPMPGLCDVTCDSTNQSETESETEENKSEVSDDSRKKPKRRRRNKKHDGKLQQEVTQEVPRKNLVRMSVYEERCLLRQLQEHCDVTDAHVRRLIRKLIVRQLKRERGLPCFDPDFVVNDAISRKCHLYGKQFINNKVGSPDVFHSAEEVAAIHPAPVNILDRFQNVQCVARREQGASFLNKLAGTEDDQQSSIRSPYTARLLKPFIRRDYESRPVKLRLLQQIQAHPHRSDPDWIPPARPPIDYCYVQPQHIPAVNTLCREFFWPGVDMSECLQYPDFSCVVLYRKCVIGFAFMVPDVKYNEAYISFVFTHPEWRRAGIATFMVYHLIQTCMGKDVTLHVSASNPAMLLYQKFGFKAEEFILDFYDKYFAIDSRECRHAFYLRLKR